jgi:mono/diheme cytochrome c family protein
LIINQGHDRDREGGEMKRATIAAVLGGTAAVFLSCAAPGQTRADLGKAEYYSNCAVCHGVSGKGEGSFGEVLKATMPDLTTIAKRNGGVFPVDRVMMNIDGRATPRAHGTSEMPIWGSDYSLKGGQYFRGFTDYSPVDVESYVRARILALIDYLHRLQVM